MSLFKRIKNIWAKPAPVQAEKSILSLTAGDVCEVSLVTYQVTGRTQNRSRNAVVLTLQDGTDIRYLCIEERERTVFALYEQIDGRLDEIDEVPTTLELDDRAYHMEEHFSGMIMASGKTPFMQGGEQHVWQYQSDDMRLLRVEWQDGRFMLYTGESVLPADVHVLRGV
ncbi:DUF4178 domain-containing protein [Paenibacillus sp. NPDC058174]|uniref:DUF4178 domain-containing protein n=1 Tax=Paenibacillus sp. NPDC058174 TaxID=3346366 RepID=UPI0036DB43AA